MVIQPRRFAKRDGLGCILARQRTARTPRTPRSARGDASQREACYQDSEFQSGFTLLELLLVMVLLLGLLAALVFNFSTLRAGADLEEGARQFEALIRFASAHAANNGKTVQLRFADDIIVSTNAPSASDTNSAPAQPSIDLDSDVSAQPKLRLVWEPDPIGQPGVFVDVQEAAPILEAVLERIRIDRVQLPARLLNQSTNEPTAVSGATLDSTGPAMPPISFFPDGSSDVADIVLVSKNTEDLRRVNIHLAGVTGQVRSELKPPDEFVPVEWMDAENAEKSADPNQNQTVTTTVGAAETGKGEFDFSEPEEMKRETTKTNDFPDF